MGAPSRFEAEAVQDSTWTRLTVRAEGKDRLRVAVVCRLLDEGEKATDKVYDVVPMSKWAE